jgi:hypothetical protein
MYSLICIIEASLTHEQNHDLVGVALLCVALGSLL